MKNNILRVNVIKPTVKKAIKIQFDYFFMYMYD